jgi:biopolymer transport protein ExbD
MLDVVFILLIFFIVTAQFIVEPGALINRQDVENDVKVKQLGILVAIDSESKFHINKEEVDISELGFMIREMRKDSPQGEIVVQTDKESDARALVQVLEVISGIEGYRPVHIATESEF